VERHAFLDGRMTRADQAAGSFKFNDTDPARSGWSEVAMVAKRGNRDSRFFRSLKDCHPGLRFDFPMVYPNA
jgi:hypothetical protein